MMSQCLEINHTSCNEAVVSEGRQRDALRGKQTKKKNKTTRRPTIYFFTGNRRIEEGKGKKNNKRKDNDHPP